MTPKFIILNTNVSIDKLCTVINNARVIPISELRLILLILDLLVFEKDAELELSNERSIDIIEHPYDTTVNDNREILNTALLLGKDIFEELQKLKLYESGILNFNYSRLLGKDIVMERVQYDSELLQHKRTNYSQLFNNWIR